MIFFFTVFHKLTFTVFFLRDQILTGELDSKQEIAGIHNRNFLYFMIKKFIPVSYI